MNKERQTAISPTREQDYPEWYQEVIKAAELAENSQVRGCMVIRPWGYGLWENIQRELDWRIKKTGHDNAYFPLFIPLSLLEKEASHVEGFAKECAVVTHHRLEAKDGKLVPTGELDEPLVVRPTSETIIGESFSKWVRSYRDLPLLINQWANVVRWEMRTRLFLRTSEFLWQEGHTVHADEADAMKEVMVAVEFYRELIEEVLAMPVIIGKKPEAEKFPGAVETFCLEAMMQDRKALQAGTSHYLGQNFAKASNIKYSNEDGELVYAHTTSWGVSTRLIGGMIMIHGDDDGLRVPPRVAPKHIVIIPVVPKPELRSEVFAYADKIAADLEGTFFYNVPIRVEVDKRDIRGGDKTWQWIKKGIPLRIEVGPKDIANNQVVLCRRDREYKEKDFLPATELKAKVLSSLDKIQKNYFNQAKAYQEKFTESGLSSFEELLKYFTHQNSEKPEIHGGFVRAKWCGTKDSLDKLSEMKVTIRCLPLDQDNKPGKCILTGEPATLEAIFAKAY